MIDYYAALEITPDATPAQIKNAYRRLARRLHPDVNPDPWAAERFKEVAEAYEVLRNEIRRAEYDATPRAAAPVAQPESPTIAILESCRLGVETLKAQSRQEKAQRHYRRADVYAMAADMLDKSLTDIYNAMRSPMVNAAVRKPAVVALVERFLETVDPTESIGDERSSEHLRSGVLGMVGLSRVTTIVGGGAEPQAKEAAARAVMFALSTALISVGVVRIAPPTDTASRLSAARYEERMHSAFRELDATH